MPYSRKWCFEIAGAIQLPGFSSELLTYKLFKGGSSRSWFANLILELIL